MGHANICVIQKFILDPLLNNTEGRSRNLFGCQWRSNQTVHPWAKIQDFHAIDFWNSATSQHVLAKDAMLRIQWMSTGEDVISVDRDVLVEPSCTGIPILAIKRYLQGIIGQPRFKQRLLFDRTILDDSAEVTVPLLLHLVVLSDYCDSSPENRRQFMYAVMNNRAQELERMLSEPQANRFFFHWGKMKWEDWSVTTEWPCSQSVREHANGDMLTNTRFSGQFFWPSRWYSHDILSLSIQNYFWCLGWFGFFRIPILVAITVRQPCIVWWPWVLWNAASCWWRRKQIWNEWSLGMLIGDISVGGEVWGQGLKALKA